MTRADEEARALLFRQNVTKRLAAEQARAAKLTGNGAAVQALRTAQEPLILARLEADGGDSGDPED